MDKSLDLTLNAITSMLLQARSIIDTEATPDGKVGVKTMQLAERIGMPFGKTDAEIYQMLRMFLERCPDIEVRKGRNGGIYKKVISVLAVESVQPVVSCVHQEVA